MPNRKIYPMYINGNLQIAKLQIELFLSLLSLNTQRSMRHSTESTSRDELTRLATDAIRFVLNTYERGLQTLDKLHLTLSQPHRLFLRECIGTLLQYFISRSRVVVCIVVTVAQRTLQVIVVALSQLQFL